MVIKFSTVIFCVCMWFDLFYPKAGNLVASFPPWKELSKKNTMYVPGIEAFDHTKHFLPTSRYCSDCFTSQAPLPDLWHLTLKLSGEINFYLTWSDNSTALKMVAYGLSPEILRPYWLVICRTQDIWVKIKGMGYFRG